MKAPGDEEDAGEGADESRDQRHNDADALDEIEEGIRAFLAMELSGIQNADALAESIATWLETLYNRLRGLPHQAHKEDDNDDDADDMIDMLTILLSTCADNRWRCVIITAQKNDSISNIAFDRENLMMWKVRGILRTM
uniref:Uncharacterized protein n=1 Tax=Globisporangium ultimum (strain ATCC 200006 / CBS 805.95 / DAOM BR144) TaxID=431595 RepID=K3WA08_GLOUD